MRQMLVPSPWQGPTASINQESLFWLKDLPSDTYCALWLRWPKSDLPPGHDLYVVSFHLEMVDVEWVQRQAQNLDAPIILLSDLCYHDFPFHANVFAYTYYHWHEQTRLIQQWFPTAVPKKVTFKASAFCNRITQSKLWVFTALTKYLKGDCLLKLDDWLEEKNVHHREPVGVAALDELSNIFWQHHWGTKHVIDRFVTDQDNHQRFTSNPYSRAYVEALINFTNESFHYSYHWSDGQSFIYPGPFLTEKTLKCLVGATPFIAVGQFQTYHALTNLGFMFDYGPLNLSWDLDPGNLSRMIGVIDLIQGLADVSLEDLASMTKVSTEHNAHHIRSGDFWQVVTRANAKIKNQILLAHS